MSTPRTDLAEMAYSTGEHDVGEVFKAMRLLELDLTAAQEWLKPKLPDNRPQFVEEPKEGAGA